MNKTTTLLVAAGMIFLAGCKTEIMKERRYVNEPPAEDPADNRRQAQPVPQRYARPLPPPTESGFQPMGGEFSNDGIEEETPRRRPARKTAAVSKAPRKGGKRAVAGKGGVYVVKSGDTLGWIARRHGVSVNALRAANNRTAAQDRTLSIGTKLVIPAGGAPVKKQGGKAVRQTAAPKVTGKLNADGTYTMVKGDNIPRVARKFGIRAKALQAANNLSDEATTKLQIGHKLIIPTNPEAKIGGRKKAASSKTVKQVSKPAVQAQAAQKQVQPPVADPVRPTAPAEQAGRVDGDVAKELPPDSAVDTAANDTKYVSTSGYASLEEFAKKHNTTVEVLRQMNPRLDPAEPLSTHDMLYVPNK